MTTGQLNQRRGKQFEILCATMAQKAGFDARAVDRTHRRGDSLPDIEFVDYPDLSVDCKYTTGFFSFADLAKKLDVCQAKYGNIPVIIYGEQRDRTRISRETIGVAMASKHGPLLMSYVDWLQMLKEGDIPQWDLT